MNKLMIPIVGALIAFTAFPARAQLAKPCLKATGEWNFVAVRLDGYITTQLNQTVLSQWNKGLAPRDQILSVECSIGRYNYYAYYKFPNVEHREMFSAWIRGMAATWSSEYDIPVVIMTREAAKAVR